MKAPSWGWRKSSLWGDPLSKRAERTREAATYTHTNTHTGVAWPGKAQLARRTGKRAGERIQRPRGRLGRLPRTSFARRGETRAPPVGRDCESGHDERDRLGAVAEDARNRQLPLLCVCLCVCSRIWESSNAAVATGRLKIAAVLLRETRITGAAIPRSLFQLGQNSQLRRRECIMRRPLRRPCRDPAMAVSNTRVSLPPKWSAQPHLVSLSSFPLPSSVGGSGCRLPKRSGEGARGPLNLPPPPEREEGMCARGTGGVPAGRCSR